jgi:hypothetical protein
MYCSSTRPLISVGDNRLSWRWLSLSSMAIAVATTRRWRSTGGGTTTTSIPMTTPFPSYRYCHIDLYGGLWCGGYFLSDKTQQDIPGPYIPIGLITVAHASPQCHHNLGLVIARSRYHVPTLSGQDRITFDNADEKGRSLTDGCGCQTLQHR